jgi:hypothetical protein
METKPEGSAPAIPSVPAVFLERFVCPLGRAPLRLEGDSFVCTRCGLTYAMDDGVLNFLFEDAKLPAGVARIEDLPCYPR